MNEPIDVTPEATTERSEASKKFAAEMDAIIKAKLEQAQKEVESKWVTGKTATAGGVGAALGAGIAWLVQNY